MNELNELEKDIFEVLVGFKHKHAKDKSNNHPEIFREYEMHSKKLSKFFLEKIKEAYKAGRHAEFVGYPNSVDDYLKSKYKI